VTELEVRQQRLRPGDRKGRIGVNLVSEVVRVQVQDGAGGRSGGRGVRVSVHGDTGHGKRGERRIHFLSAWRPVGPTRSDQVTLLTDEVTGQRGPRGQIGDREGRHFTTRQLRNASDICQNACPGQGLLDRSGLVEHVRLPEGVRSYGAIDTAKVASGRV